MRINAASRGGSESIVRKLIINDFCYLFEFLQVLVVIRQLSFITCSSPHSGSLVPDQIFVQKKIEKYSQQYLPECGSICRVLEVLLGTLPQVSENL